jgi:uncharacterized protein with GYD domain
MVLFLQTAKHSPESCPMHNETVKKVFVNYNAKLGALSKKHGIKIVGGWAVTPEHTTVMIFDAPDPNAMMKFMGEPEAMTWQSYQVIKTRPVVAMAEVMKLLK